MNILDVRCDDFQLFDVRLGPFVAELCGDMDRTILLYSSDQLCPQNEELMAKGLIRAGECQNFTQHSRVFIFIDAIRKKLAWKEGRIFGGNVTSAESVTHAAYLVLAHELRHVWQFTRFGHPTWDKNLPYVDQPHEVDARAFVDDASRLIYDFVHSKGSRRAA